MATTVKMEFELTADQNLARVKKNMTVKELETELTRVAQRHLGKMVSRETDKVVDSKSFTEVNTALGQS